MATTLATAFSANVDSSLTNDDGVPSIDYFEIDSGTVFDCTGPLPTAADLNVLYFTNNTGDSGILTVETTALETSGGAVGIGGVVQNFLPGDSIVVRDLATDYALFDQSPDAAAQNASVAGT